MGNDKLKVFIVTHKDFEKPNLDGYCSIGVGNNQQQLHTDYSDYPGDNISDKNSTFCELTALYWINKNIDYDEKGLVHYRRYFYHRFLSLFKYKLYTTAELEKILCKYQVILPTQSVIADHKLKTIYDHYCYFHYKKDIDEMIKVIKEVTPEYYDSCTEVLKWKKASLCNMIVANSDIISRYCDFVFKVLFELEKRIDITGYDQYQTRIYGFLGEYLINVFFAYNKDIKIKYLPICNTDVSPTKTYFAKIIGSFRRMLVKN